MLNEKSRITPVHTNVNILGSYASALILGGDKFDSILDRRLDFLQHLLQKTRCMSLTFPCLLLFVFVHTY